MIDFCLTVTVRVNLTERWGRYGDRHLCQTVRFLLTRSSSPVLTSSTYLPTYSIQSRLHEQPHGFEIWYK